MKTFLRFAAQGDVFFERVESMPKALVRVHAVDGKLIVAHSETGHHHVIEADRAVMYRLPEEIYECFLVVGDQGAVIKHERPFDTHESIRFEPGVYKVRRQREHTPEGLRRVAD